MALTITCPPDRNSFSGNALIFGESTDPSNTGSATASSTLDPNPQISYSDSVVSDTDCRRVIRRTWRAEDNTGAVQTCDQTIELDAGPPVFTKLPDNLIIPGASSDPDMVLGEWLYDVEVEDHPHNPNSDPSDVFVYDDIDFNAIPGPGPFYNFYGITEHYKVTFTVENKCGKVTSEVRYFAYERIANPVILF